MNNQRKQIYTLISLIFLLATTYLISYLSLHRYIPNESLSNSHQHETLQYNASLGHKPNESAYSAFTLIPYSGNAKIDIVNMSGETVHTWDFDVARARLLPNCNLLVVHGSKWGLKRQRWLALRSHIREYDWNGELVWEYVAPGEAHHDVQRLPNGNTLILYRTVLPTQYQNQIINPERRAISNRTDEIIEVTSDGTIVWEWKFHEHNDVNNCGLRACEPPSRSMGMGKKPYDWTHINTISVIPENKWFTQGDTRFKPGNIMIMVRNWSTIMVIEKNTGDVVWRFSGTHRASLDGGHESHMIPEGLPGAGNILVFNNGVSKKMSTVLEVNPIDQNVLWEYGDGEEFFSHAASAIQRLPNGNTFVSLDVPGKSIEITPEKKIVWRHTNPYRTCRGQKYEQTFCPQLARLPIH